MTYNLLTCGGWEGVGEKAVNFAAGSCMKGRIGLVFLFFLIAIIRRWGGEEVGLNFNFMFALILGLIPYIIVIFLTGSLKAAFVIGLVGALVGGYVGGMMTGGEE